MNQSNIPSSTGTQYPSSDIRNCYFARLMTPDEVDLATTRQPPEVKRLTQGAWALCGDVSAQMFNLLAKVPAKNFPVRLTGFSSPSGTNYCVFTHQVQHHQSRFALSLQDEQVKLFLESMASSGRMTFTLGNDDGNQSLLVDCPLKLTSFLPLLTMIAEPQRDKQPDDFRELPLVLEAMANPLQIPTMLRGYSVQHVSVSMLLPSIVSDAYRKLLTKVVGA